MMPAPGDTLTIGHDRLEVVSLDFDETLPTPELPLGAMSPFRCRLRNPATGEEKLWLAYEESWGQYCFLPVDPRWMQAWLRVALQRLRAWRWRHFRGPRALGRAPS